MKLIFGELRATTFARTAATLLVAAAAFNPAWSQPDQTNYRLRPGDTITMSVFQEPDMQTTARITVEGTANFPLIGSLEVAGKPVPELRDELTQLYNADYLVNPQISLEVSSYAPKRVRVRGRVNQPGFVIIPPEEQYTLLDAIAAAGDIAPNGNDRRVELHRIDKDGNTRIRVFDLSQKDGEQASVRVQDSDTVIVPEKLF